MKNVAVHHSKCMCLHMCMCMHMYMLYACAFFGGVILPLARTIGRWAHRRARTQRVQETVALSGHRSGPTHPRGATVAGGPPGALYIRPLGLRRLACGNPAGAPGVPGLRAGGPDVRLARRCLSTVRTALVRAPPPPETVEGGAPPRGVR